MHNTAGTSRDTNYAVTGEKKIGTTNFKETNTAVNTNIMLNRSLEELIKERNGCEIVKVYRRENGDLKLKKNRKALVDLQTQKYYLYSHIC